MLEQATAHQQASSENVAKCTQEADAIRQSALKQAEATRNQAARDAENRIATAHRQAAMMKERLEEQYAWRKEQLERESAALMQRKKAVIAQLNNLKGLAGEAESAYPDTDPFAEEANGETTDDATIVMSPKSSQAQQKSTDSQTDQTTHPAGDDGEAAHLDDPASQRTQVIPAVKKLSLIHI